ncbi:MAG: SAF domain-containing protein [Mycobacterium leprae]
MNRQLRIWLAVGLAVLSACLTLLVLGGSGSPTRTSVVVTTRAIAPYTVLTEQDLSVMNIDGDTAKLLFPSAYQAKKDLIGLIAVRQLRKNEVLAADEQAAVTRANLAEAVQEVPLSALVPDGQRAIILQSVQTGAQPGDYIQLFKVKDGAVRPVLNHNLQVVAERNGGLVVVVSEGEAVTILAAEAEGGLQAVLAPYSAANG